MQIGQLVTLCMTAIALAGAGRSHAEGEDNGQKAGSPEQVRIMEQDRQREKASTDNSDDSPYSYGDWDSRAVGAGSPVNTRFGVGWESRMGVDVDRGVESGSGTDTGFGLTNPGASAVGGSAGGSSIGGSSIGGSSMGGSDTGGRNGGRR